MNVPQPSEARRVAAGLLLDAGCASVFADEPFRLPSGWASPVYMDCRRLISFPAIRRELVAMGIARLRATAALEGIAAVAGGEASGIALAAWIAEALDLPLHYVRKQAKGQGQVEGFVERGRQVLLVDDLVAAGHSKLLFAAALRAAGAGVSDAFVVFDYGTFAADRLLETIGLRLHALTSWTEVLAVARERQAFGARALAELETFLHHPSDWSLAHGGIAARSGHIEEPQT